jgi:hypothetical protein
MRQLMSRIPEQQAEPEPDFGQQLESLYDDSGFADPAAMQQLIQQQAERIVEQRMAPLTQQFQEMQAGHDGRAAGRFAVAVPRPSGPAKRPLRSWMKW